MGGATSSVLAASMLMFAVAAAGTWLSGHQTGYALNFLDFVFDLVAPQVSNVALTSFTFCITN